MIFEIMFPSFRVPPFAVLPLVEAIASVARDVEAAIENNMPFASKKEDYLAKARQLVFNLKKNDQLRCSTRDHIRLKVLSAFRSGYRAFQAAQADISAPSQFFTLCCLE